jgi:small subunit ribosomal protein S5
MDNRNNPRRPRPTDKPGETPWQEQVISIDRVARVVKGGRRFRFRALVAVGDGKTKVGVGVSKGSDVQAAITKAVAAAKRSVTKVPIKQGTIPHQITVRHGGALVMLRPASPGTGVIAGGVVRSVLDVTGIANILSKSLGSNNKINTAYATIEALNSLVPKTEWVTTRHQALAAKPKVKSVKPAAKPARPAPVKKKAPVKTKPKAAKAKAVKS